MQNKIQFTFTDYSSFIFLDNLYLLTLLFVYRFLLKWNRYDEKFIPAVNISNKSTLIFLSSIYLWQDQPSITHQTRLTTKLPLWLLEDPLSSFKSTPLTYNLLYCFREKPSANPVADGLGEGGGASRPIRIVVRLVACGLLVPNAEHLRAELGHGDGSACGWEAEGVDPAGFHAGWEGWCAGGSHGANQTRVALWPGCDHRNCHHPYNAGHISFHKELCRLVALFSIIWTNGHLTVCSESECHSFLIRGDDFRGREEQESSTLQMKSDMVIVTKSFSKIFSHVTFWCTSRNLFGTCISIHLCASY